MLRHFATILPSNECRKRKNRGRSFATHNHDQPIELHYCIYACQICRLSVRLMQYCSSIYLACCRCFNWISICFFISSFSYKYFYSRWMSLFCLSAATFFFFLVLFLLFVQTLIEYLFSNIIFGMFSNKMNRKKKEKKKNFFLSIFVLSSFYIHFTAIAIIESIIAKYKNICV